MTERLRGRRIQIADFAYVREIDTDARVMQTLFGTIQTEQQSRLRLQRWLQMWSERGIGFWLFSELAGATVGHGGLFPSPREVGEVEVGYVLKPAYWGRGFSTEITREALRVGFEVVGFQRIIAIAQTTNVASRRVMEKCGMILECERPFPDGVPGVRYAMTKANYAPLKP